jgi:hypothetical protein
MQTATNGGGTLLQKMQAAKAAKRAQLVEIDGKLLTPAEHQRYLALLKAQAAGNITELKIRPALTLYAHTADGKKKALGPKYHPVLAYERLGVLVVEDALRAGLPLVKRHLRDHWVAQSGNAVVEIE